MIDVAAMIIEKQKKFSFLEDSWFVTFRFFTLLFFFFFFSSSQDYEFLLFCILIDMSVLVEFKYTIYHQNISNATDARCNEYHREYYDRIPKRSLKWKTLDFGFSINPIFDRSDTLKEPRWTMNIRWKWWTEANDIQILLSTLSLSLSHYYEIYRGSRNLRVDRL